MSAPFDSLRPACRLVTPYECSCGSLNLDPSLPAARIEYLKDAHILGPELAAERQLAREDVLARIMLADTARQGYWDRMLSGSSPRLQSSGGD